MALPAVEVLVEDDGWVDIAADCEALCAEAAALALSEAGIDAEAVEISALLTSDARIAELNAEYRGMAGPTNVLSWPALDLAPAAEGAAPPPPAPPPGQPLFLGDIALARETVLAEAARQRKRARDHATHLIVHAVLHLLGYDHESDADARLMERLETKALLRAGLSDPYMERTAVETGPLADRNG